MKFIDLGLSDKTIHAIEEFGIVQPTTVQCDVIPSILEGKDVFTIAPANCGKTMSYIFPLIDIISRKNQQNILIITPNSEQAVLVSDKLSIFNKYHEINETTLTENEDSLDSEANVIIGSPDLLVDLVENGKFDFSKTNILIVDDINLIKKNKQLNNLEKILDILPSEKQNIVYTNRRSKETQSILEKILKTPQEIKIDKNKESETAISNEKENIKENISDKKFSNKKTEKRTNKNSTSYKDKEALDLAKKYKSFNGKVPEFILFKAPLAEDKDCASCNINSEKISTLY